MNWDPIEEYIAGWKPPEPTPDFDERMQRLLAGEPVKPSAARYRRIAIVVAIGLISMGLLWLVVNLASLDSQTGVDEQFVHLPKHPRQTIETVELEIPALDFCAVPVWEEPLLDSGTVLVVTSVETAEKERRE